jgi:hypothetical protein
MDRVNLSRILHISSRFYNKQVLCFLTLNAQNFVKGHTELFTLNPLLLNEFTALNNLSSPCILKEP